MTDTALRIPPFTVRVRSGLSSVIEHLKFFYRTYPSGPSDGFVDFDICIAPGRGTRRLVRRQARFVVDGEDPFLPLPIDQAAPLLEWGLNWTIASRPLGFLVMHAAVLARDHRAVVLPGFPGAGKSTLCASLAWLHGWRLLSDELAILDPVDGMLVPNPRPISLKNESISIVASFPGVEIGPSYLDTRKGTISLASIPPASIAAAEERAQCEWMVFPTFTPGAAPSLEEITRAESFALISEQSFNRERMGETGFLALCAMLDRARCFRIEYGSTDDGLDLMERICRT